MCITQSDVKIITDESKGGEQRRMEEEMESTKKVLQKESYVLDTPENIQLC